MSTYIKEVSLPVTTSSFASLGHASLDTAKAWAKPYQNFSTNDSTQSFLAAAALSKAWAYLFITTLLDFFLRKIKEELVNRNLGSGKDYRKIILKFIYFILVYPYWYFLVWLPHDNSKSDRYWLMGGFALTVFLALGLHALIITSVIA